MDLLRALKIQVLEIRPVFGPHERRGSAMALIYLASNTPDGCRKLGSACTAP